MFATMTDSVEDIREKFQQHTQTCNVCGRSGLCPAGMELAKRIEQANRPVISADAQFIAGKIVKHL
jgi:hypothetical protein